MATTPGLQGRPTPAEGARRPPLEGIRVIDMGQIYNGPYCSFLMAMAGADVVKVEPPGGENMRRRTVVGGAALPFAMLNSNKRFATLNLKSDRGRALLFDMVTKADILVENFAPGTLERLGAGYDVLAKINPRLIYAQGSGYGRSGPYRDYPAMDLTIQAMAGIMSVTGFPDRPPVKAGAALADFFGGTHLFGAAMTALYERERTGLGRMVEVSMQEAVYASLASNLGLWFGSKGGVPVRTGNLHGGLAEAPYNVYPTTDGHIALFCVGEAQWSRLLTAIGREDLEGDPRYSTLKERVDRMKEVDELVTRFTSVRTKEEASQAFIRHRVPSAPVRDLTEVVSDRHMHERHALEWVDHPELGRVPLQNSPLRFHGTEPLEIEPSGPIGSDNVEVYGEWLGLSPAEVEDLAAAQAI